MKILLSLMICHVFFGFVLVRYSGEVKAGRGGAAECLVQIQLMPSLFTYLGFSFFFNFF